VFVSHCGPRPVVTVVGALDARGAVLLSAVLDQVRRSERAAAEVDLSRVDYADSHGLAPLLDGRVTVRRISPVVGRLLVALDVPSRRPSSNGPAPG
jgi:anti-anti-sigma regulatory factor